MIAELLIYVPSITNFQLYWLQDRLGAARTAALSIAASPGGMLPDDLTLQILGSIDAKTVAIRTSRTRRLAISHHMPSVTRDLDMRDISVVRAVIDSFETLFFAENDLMRVVGPSPDGRRLSRNRHRGGVIAEGSSAVFSAHPAVVICHFRHRRDADLSRSALSVRSPYAPGSIAMPDKSAEKVPTTHLRE